MNVKPLIYVIIPVYNAAKYLQECLKSVAEQTYSNIEIILVDDGSQDESPRMCDDFAQRDYRIKVIHQKNRGVSSARNLGMKTSKGEYLTFVDADDVLDPTILEQLYSSMVECDASISMARMKSFSGDFSLCEKKHKVGMVKTLSNIDACKYIFLYQIAAPFAKLYKSDCAKKHFFPENRRIGEDVAFNYPNFYESTTIVLLESKLYYYRMHEESATGVYTLKCLEEIDTFKEMLQYYKEKKEIKLYQCMSLELFARLQAHLRNINTYFPNSQDSIQLVNEKLSNLLNDENQSIKNRMMFALGRWFPKFFLRFFFNVGFIRR